jgi:hypothetical protein
MTHGAIFVSLTHEKGSPPLARGSNTRTTSRPASRYAAQYASSVQRMSSTGLRSW